MHMALMDKAVDIHPTGNTAMRLPPALSKPITLHLWVVLRGYRDALAIF